MSVRLLSDCSKKDYKFSLNGSTKAINFVIPKKWIQQRKQKALIEIKEKRIKDSLFAIKREKEIKKKRIKDSLSALKRRKEIETKRKIDSLRSEEKLKKLLQYTEKYKEKNFKFVSCKPPSTRFFKKTQDLEIIFTINMDKILVIDTDFKNKVFYKVVEIEGGSQRLSSDYFVFKKEVSEIK